MIICQMKLVFKGLVIWEKNIIIILFINLDQGLKKWDLCDKKLILILLKIYIIFSFLLYFL